MSDLAIYEEMSLPSLAESMFKSGLFADTKSLAQAIVKIVAGRELGLGPVAAMRGIDLIQGNVALSASLTAALIKQSGRYTYFVIEHTDQACSIEFHERMDGGWQPIGTSSFTIQMAERAGLVAKDVWMQYPEAMLFARAMTQGAGWFCPDATDGRVYTREELGADLLEEGSEAAATPAESHPTTASEHRSGSDGRVTKADGVGKAAAADTSPTDPEPSSGGADAEEASSVVHQTTAPPDPISTAYMRERFGGALALAKAVEAMFPGRSAHSLTPNQREQILATIHEVDQEAMA